MKRLLPILILSLVSSVAAFGQVVLPDGYSIPDSLYYQPTADLDSTLYGRDVFNFLSSNSAAGSSKVRVHQTDAVRNMVEAQISANRTRKMSGWRIRIFFDNSQNARNASAGAEGTFHSRFPGVKSYRTYEDPFFKVLVGDFRDRSEAMEFLLKLKGMWPSACIVKSDIGYPIVDPSHANDD